MIGECCLLPFGISMMYLCKNKLKLIMLAVALCESEMIYSWQLHHVNKREERCPVVKDADWKLRDSNCTDGKQYHCFENESGSIVEMGCFTAKKCLKGAHPVVEGKIIVCAFCKEGFQPTNLLNSIEYRFSYCIPHNSPCDPSNGQTLCRKGTRERNRACACDATLGFQSGSNSSQCQCFTPDDPCSMCIFKGCPSGSFKNKQGYCEEIKDVTVVTSTTSSTTTESQDGPQTDDDLPSWIIALIIISILILAYIVSWILLFLLHRRNGWQFPKRKCTTESTEESQTTTQTEACLPGYKILIIVLPPVALFLICCFHHLEKSSTSSAQDNPDGIEADNHHINQPGKPSLIVSNVYINTVKHVNIGSNLQDMSLPKANTHSEHENSSPTTSSAAQNPRAHLDDPAESASEPQMAAFEEAEPLLPTAAPSEPTSLPSGVTGVTVYIGKAVGLTNIAPDLQDKSLPNASAVSEHGNISPATSSVAQNPRAHLDDPAESASELPLPALEEAEPLLPTALPFEPTSLPSGATVPLPGPSAVSTVSPSSSIISSDPHPSLPSETKTSFSQALPSQSTHPTPYSPSMQSPDEVKADGEIMDNSHETWQQGVPETNSAGDYTNGTASFPQVLPSQSTHPTPYSPSMLSTDEAKTEGKTTDNSHETSVKDIWQQDTPEANSAENGTVPADLQRVDQQMLDISDEIPSNLQQDKQPIQTTCNDENDIDTHRPVHTSHQKVHRSCVKERQAVLC